MKIKLLTLFFLLLFLQSQAQQYIFGKILSEAGNEIKGAEVVNITNSQKTVSDTNGNFMIEALIAHQIRVAKEGFERKNIILKKEDFTNSLQIVLQSKEILIDEVQLAYKPTGNLKEDIKHVGDSRKTAAMKGDVVKYIRQKSDPEVLKPQPGDFVQPLGPGFPVGKVQDKWDVTDFYAHLTQDLGAQFFKDMDIKKEEIFTFLHFALHNFNTKEILKYGYYSSSDFMKIQLLLDEKVKMYKMKK